MKVSKSQLKRIIKEEKRKLFEMNQWGNQESLSPLVTFGQAWAGMGGAVQEQMVELVNAHIEGRITDAVYEMNPNALDVAYDRLGNVLNILGQVNPDAEELLDAMDEARSIFEQGEAEVEADAAAAGDRPPGRAGVTESLLREPDTDVYEGDHDPIRIEIPALEKIAPEQNFDGKKVWFSDSDASKIADMLEDGPPDTSEIDYDDDARAKSEEWDKIDDLLDGWGDDDREELAKNIRDGIKQAEDAGYEY